MHHCANSMHIKKTIGFWIPGFPNGKVEKRQRYGKVEKRQRCGNATVRLAAKAAAGANLCGVHAGCAAGL